MEEVVLCFSLKYNGDFNSIYKAISNKEPKTKEEFTVLLNKLDTEYISIFSDKYPDKFKSMNRPPFVLYYKGEFDLLSKDCVSLIGKVNESGIDNIDIVLKDILKYDLVPVLLSQDDSEKQLIEKLNDLCVPTVVIVENGITKCLRDDARLQKVLDNGGLVLSEIPFETDKRMPQFIAAKLSVALADEVVVLQTDLEEKGSFILYDLIDQNKLYSVVASKKESELKHCDALIALGADQFESVEKVKYRIQKRKE